MSTQLQIPAIGWRTAITPCSECFATVAKESNQRLYAGQQQDCYSCGNRMTVERTSQIAGHQTDMLSTFERGEHAVKKWDVVELAFHERHYPRGSASAWMERYGLEGFPESVTKRSIDWAVYTKKSNSGASVLVHLDDGVVGRCLLVEA